ncbi:MAG: hypothetical protein G01um101444_96 [Parcubacteria group bacterium Gr01-1014_44]|nr:MAG: hypothetical protein G01um101444_96 [Parcubacteria group bacterium Gr01-1014_44]
MAWKVIVGKKDIGKMELEEEIFGLLATSGDPTLDFIGALLRDKLIFANDQEIQLALDNLVKKNKISKVQSSFSQYGYFRNVVRSC